MKGVVIGLDWVFQALKKLRSGNQGNSMSFADVPLIQMVPEVLENYPRVLERVPAIFTNVPGRIKGSRGP